MEGFAYLVAGVLGAYLASGIIGGLVAAVAIVREVAALGWDWERFRVAPYQEPSRWWLVPNYHLHRLTFIAVTGLARAATYHLFNPKP